MTTVPTIVGHFGTPAVGDGAATTSRTTSVLPTCQDGDVIYCWSVGGANTWKHVLTAPGVTFVLEEYNNSIAGHLSAVTRGYVTSGATATGAVVTGVLTDAADATQSSKMEVLGTVWRGSDNGGTNGSNATHRRAMFVVSGNALTVTAPAVTASTIANCGAMVCGAFSRGSNVPQIATITVDGGAVTRESWSQGTSSLHGGAILNSTTIGVSSGVTLGTQVFTVDQNGSPRGSSTILIAPLPDPPPSVTLVYDFEGLRAEGYTGSLSDMRRQNLLELLSLTEPQAKSNNDLEMQYLRSIGKTGSIQDMRNQ